MLSSVDLNRYNVLSIELRTLKLKIDADSHRPHTQEQIDLCKAMDYIQGIVKELHAHKD